MKSLNRMAPDEVCGWIQGKIRSVCGDTVENNSRVYARNGYYFIELRNWKRHTVIYSPGLRRQKIAAWLKGQWPRVRPAK